MTLTERIAMAQRLEEIYRAERMGLIQAKIGKPLSRECFKEAHVWEGFSRGYEEGRLDDDRLGRDRIDQRDPVSDRARRCADRLA